MNNDEAGLPDRNNSKDGMVSYLVGYRVDNLSIIITKDSKVRGFFILPLRRELKSKQEDVISGKPQHHGDTSYDVKAAYVDIYQNG